MASNQDDGSNPRVAATIPSHKKTALEWAADKRSSPGNRVYVATIVSEAIDEWLANHWDDLPEEARDLLDDDLMSDGGPRLPPEHLRDGRDQR